MIDYLREVAGAWPAAGVSLLLALVAGVGLWLIHNAITPFDDRKVLFHERNVAYTVQRVALLLAFGVAALPTISRGAGEAGWTGLGEQAIELVWVLAALLGVRYVVDAVVLRENNTAELLRGNLALGILEAGFYVGFGFIVNGSLIGSSGSLGTDVASTVVFGLLGLGVLVGVWWLHELLTPWSIRGRVLEGSLTAGLEAGGVLAAVGIVVREGVRGDFTGWGDGLVAFLVTVVFAVGTLYLFRWIANRTILRDLTIRQIQEKGVVTAAGYSAGLMVVVAVSVAAVVRTQL